MIWLTWRQFRLQAVVVYAALAVLAIALVLTGGRLVDAYHDGAATFLDRIGADRSEALYVVGGAVAYVLPAIIGAFWGAPMVARELEAGTHRLVWSQSITRSRWLGTKLGLGMLGAATVGAVAGLAMTWWAHPIDSAVNAGHSADGIIGLARLDPVVFASRGIAPIGYAVLAFALGVAAGVLLRRTVPAMAVTLAVYVLVQIALPIWVRPHLLEPARETTAITADSLRGFRAPGPDSPIVALVVAFERPGSWQLSSETVDASGTALDTIPAWVTNCLPLPPEGQPAERRDDGAREQACFARLAAEGYRQHVTYQPADHYWTLQWRETGLMLVGALLLGAVAFWRVRRLS